MRCGDALGFEQIVTDGGLEFGKPSDMVAGVLNGDACVDFATVEEAGPVAIDERFKSRVRGVFNTPPTL